MLHIWASAVRVLSGFAIAALVGISLGISIGWFQQLEDLIFLPLELLRPNSSGCLDSSGDSDVSLFRSRNDLYHVHRRVLPNSHQHNPRRREYRFITAAGRSMLGSKAVASVPRYCGPRRNAQYCQWSGDWQL